MRWTKEQEREVVRLYRNGWRIKAISEKTGIPVGSVRSKICLLRKKGEVIERIWK